jgi:AGCS family alanine or glycine:cation symporter
VVYTLLALAIVAVNITELPGMIEEIIGGAFGIKQLAGGFAGGIAAAMLTGVKRGLFACEAGLGTSITADSEISTVTPENATALPAVSIVTAVASTGVSFPPRSAPRKRWTTNRA